MSTYNDYKTAMHTLTELTKKLEFTPLDTIALLLTKISSDDLDYLSNLIFLIKLDRESNQVNNKVLSYDQKINMSLDELICYNNSYIDFNSDDDDGEDIDCSPIKDLHLTKQQLDDELDKYMALR